MLLRQRRDAVSYRLGLLLAEVGAARVQALIVVELLRVVARKRLEEVLPRARPQEEEVRPDAGRARLACRLDDLAELFGPVGDTGED